MLNYSIRRRFLACAACSALAAHSQVSNELRFTAMSVSGSGEALKISVDLAGLNSAASNGCGYVSLGFLDSLNDSLWPSASWRLDYTPVALHVFDPAKTYQRYTGAHFYRAVATTNPVSHADSSSLPAFSIGDGSGYSIVTNLPLEVGGRVYQTQKDGCFIYADMGAPHWVVWTTNGTDYGCGWPWVNAPTTNSDSLTWDGIPLTWRVATRAPLPRDLDGFARIPGKHGVVQDFYIALTETTEATASAVIAYGVSNGLCSAGAFPAMPGRGDSYPATGLTLGAAAAMCNLATHFHNSVMGEALAAVYTVGGAAFYSPVTNAALISASTNALGYRLPSPVEYARAASGDAQTVFPWGSSASEEYYYATNGLPVTELTLTKNSEVEAFYRKYHVWTTNSVGNFMSRNGSRHVSPGRVSATRAQYKTWSVPAVNTNGSPVLFVDTVMSFALFFGDTVNDAAWGVGTERVHDLAGNVGELTWPPIVRPWGNVRAVVCGGVATLDAARAQAGGSATVNASTGYSTVGFRFARNRVLGGAE